MRISKHKLLETRMDSAWSKCVFCGFLTAATCGCGLAVGHRFHLDTQRYVHPKAVRFAGGQAELFAIKHRLCIRAAQFTLKQRMRHAFERIDFQLNRLGYAVQRQRGSRLALL
jgi:hypothetical protein